MPNLQRKGFISGWEPSGSAKDHLLLAGNCAATPSVRHSSRYMMCSTAQSLVCLWHIASVSAVQRHVWSWVQTGSYRHSAKGGAIDPDRTSRCFSLGIGLTGRHGAQHLRQLVCLRPLRLKAPSEKVGGMIKARAVPVPSNSVLAPLYVGADLGMRSRFTCRRGRATISKCWRAPCLSGRRGGFAL